MAASFEQSEDVRKAQRLLTDKGYIVMVDWTKHKEIKSIPSRSEREKWSKIYAIEDSEGVKNADIFILLLGDRKSTGAHIELGVALGANVPNIFLVGDESLLGEQLFYRHKRVKRVQTVEEVIAITS